MVSSLSPLVSSAEAAATTTTASEDVEEIVSMFWLFVPLQFTNQCQWYLVRGGEGCYPALSVCEFANRYQRESFALLSLTHRISRKNMTFIGKTKNEKSLCTTQSPSFEPQAQISFRIYQPASQSTNQPAAVMSVNKNMKYTAIIIQ